jgi:hypothetical protein
VPPLVDEWTWDVPLRLLGGVHLLVRQGGASWDDVPAALEREEPFLREFLRTENVQTNEVRRTWTLVPSFVLAAALAGFDEIDLVELGPSAGLNLIPDRYRCEYRAGRVGPADAAVRLTGEERRRVGLIRPLRVGSRVGIDRDPIRADDAERLELLRAFIWADQTARLELFDHAVEELRRDPPELIRGALASELPRLLRRRRDGALTVVFQTAVFSYLSPDERAAVRDVLEEAGRDGPLAFVSSVKPRTDGATWWGLSLRVWPGEERYLADVDYHGTWIEWLA